MSTGGGIALIRYDLAHFGTVTSVLTSTSFICSNLAGFGDGSFVGYYINVSRDAGGQAAAPQGESQLITGYVSRTGQFTVFAAFSAPLAPEDQILVLHSTLANIRTPRNAKGSVTKNWKSGVATSTLPGGDLTNIGVANSVSTVNSFWISTANLAYGGYTTIRMYSYINGTLRLSYNQTFNVGTDPTGLWIINGALSVFGLVRIEIYSDKSADDGKAIDWESIIT